MKKNADLILETVLQSSAHMTAEEIHAALRDSGHRMALATVYNNLAHLTKLLQSQTDEELLSYDLQVSYICPACRRTAHPASTTDP